MLDLARVAGVVPGRLHRVRGDNGAAQRQRFQQRPEVRDLVRLPGLGDLVLADDQPGDVGDRPQQVHLLLPAGLGELAFLAVHRHRHPGRDVTGSPVTAGSSHGWPGAARNQPPARVSRSASAACGRRRRAAVCCRAAARAAAARDCAAGSSAAPATSPVSAASSSSGSR